MSASDELITRPDRLAYRLTINRPGRRNALTPGAARALAEEIDRVGGESAARAILLDGAGGHFCAGLDLHWLQTLGPRPPIDALQAGLSGFQSVILAVARCPLPVIALLRGTVAGFGLDLALACDIRLAAASARLTSAFVRMGLVPDGGSTLTLSRLAGTGRALRFLLSGETIEAETALHAGLVEEVVDDSELDDAAARLVRAIAAGAPDSVRAVKRLCRTPELGALEQALAAEGAAQLQALESAEFRDRLAAFTARTGSPGDPR